MGSALRGVWMMAGVLYSLVEAVAKGISHRLNHASARYDDTTDSKRQADLLLSSVLDDNRNPLERYWRNNPDPVPLRIRGERKWQ